MTEENRKLLERINGYAESALGEIDPQKVPVSLQLEKLKPVMEEIAAEKGMSIEDIFEKLKDSLRDINNGFDGGSPLLFR